MRFDNQVVMITGAAGSLGKAVAAGFAAGGARLALADVSEAVLQQAYPGTADTRLRGGRQVSLVAAAGAI